MIDVDEVHILFVLNGSPFPLVCTLPNSSDYNDLGIATFYTAVV